MAFVRFECVIQVDFRFHSYFLMILRIKSAIEMSANKSTHMSIRRKILFVFGLILIR